MLDPDINPIIITHNLMAAEVMADAGIPIDDLYGLMTNHLDLARGDQFHWTPRGAEIQGRAVAKVILAELAFPKPTKSGE